jgi:outer membrane protein OmpA-like peptidoglycan-associated protein
LRADTLEKYVPKNVLFERTQSVILPASFSDLDKLCVFLLRYPYLKIKIEGHTDIIGDNNMNQKLSEERAEVVKKYLIQKRVNANRIAAIGYGSTRPLINDGAKTGHPENRRVVFIVY